MTNDKYHQQVKERVEAIDDFESNILHKFPRLVKNKLKYHCNKEYMEANKKEIAECGTLVKRKRWLHLCYTG